MTVRATVTEADVRRAVKGAVAGGMKVAEVRIEAGTIRVLSEQAESPQPEPEGKPKEW